MSTVALKNPPKNRKKKRASSAGLSLGKPAAGKLTGAVLFRREKLVGKFPSIKHLSAPNATLKLPAEDRKKLLQAMVLG